MKLNSDIKDIPWKKVWIVAVPLVVIAGIALAAWSFSHRGPSQPVTPLENKVAVQQHLQKHTGLTEFKPAAGLAEEKNPWNTMEAQYAAPPDYKTVYRNIGENLVIAEQLINSEDDRKQWYGLRIATGLSRMAIDVAVDPWLAARICDAYVMPNIDKIEEKPKNGPTREQVMGIAANIYREADETDRVIELGKAYLAQAEPGLRADHIRWRLSRELEKRGDRKEALKYLREITHPTLTNEVSRRATILEQSIKNASARN